MRLLVEFLPVLLWCVLWAAGGWLLAAAFFRLCRSEVAMVGVGMGLILETWLANLLAHVLPIDVAFWLAAFFVFGAGMTSALLFRRGLRIEVSWRQWCLLGALTLLFTLIGRGLAIFDDYQNLPTISLMAVGDVPPHFALNPSLNFGYHYFLLLFAAQLMRLGGMFPWTALDVARGLIMALPLMLAALWVRRMSRSHLAGALAGAMLAFGGGSRWILLLLPPAWLARISENITLIGSASTTAPSFAEAMLTNWKIDGAGPIAFPFAFYTGINQPYIMGYTGISGSGVLILLVLLLASNRSQHWASRLILCALLAALALANEIAFLLLVFGFTLILALWLIQKRSWRLPDQLAAWLGVIAGSTLIAAFQGGLLTEIIRSHLWPAGGQNSYFDTSLSLVWPPAIVSAHLGSLSISNLSQLIGALAEIGPIVLITPLLLAWVRRCFRVGRWYEASLIAASAGSLIALFIAFKGPLFTATPRLMGGWFFACILYFVPLSWIWARRRSERLQAVVVGVGLIAMLSGLVLFGIQLLAIQRPVLTSFITPLDAKMSQEYWNKLDSKALIFDPVIYRSPTIFGRFTNSSPSWYTRTADWQALALAPNPAKIRLAGFDYMYFDKDYWDRLAPSQQSLFSAACVKQVTEVDGIHSEQNYAKDFRRLLNIETCK